MKLIRFVALLGLLLSLPFTGAGSSRVDSIGMKTVDGKQYIVYLVTAGETIYGISTQYHVPIEDLISINPELENGLKTGQIISIPYKPDMIERPVKSSDRKTHRVKSGETLYGLSQKYGIALNDLLKWNGMELKAGQTVYVSPPSSKSSENTENNLAKSSGDAEEKMESVTKTETKDTKESTADKSNTEEKPEDPDKPDEEMASKEKDNNRYVSPSSSEWGPTQPTPELGPKNKKRVMVIPFDPYLYFSDADDEIAKTSDIHRTKVRRVFRRRLNALLEPKGYETIHLLGGVFKDSLGDLNKIYKGVTYNYQEILDNGAEDPEEVIPSKNNKRRGVGIRIVDNLASSHSKSPTSDARKHRDNRYFGVKIKDPAFFDYFQTKYGIDYYIFINQFEVRTDYQTCLDRSSQNYQRNFLTHFSIFDAEGNQLAGNKITTYYDSNSNNVYKIVKDNLPQVAESIMLQLPPPAY